MDLKYFSVGRRFPAGLVLLCLSLFFVCSLLLASPSSFNYHFSLTFSLFLYLDFSSIFGRSQGNSARTVIERLIRVLKISAISHAQKDPPSPLVLALNPDFHPGTLSRMFVVRL